MRKDDDQTVYEREINKRVGLLGGTFDPIHMTHLHMAEVVREACSLDEVWFVLANVPPHKQKKDITDANHRHKMLELALESIDYFKVSLIEFERDTPSFTYETMVQLHDRYPKYKFSFIIGADMIESLPTWHQIDELVKLVSFIGVGRPENNRSPHHEYMRYVKLIDMLPSFLSSTHIRERSKQGKSIRFLVPEPVHMYIKKHELYGSTTS